MNSRRDLSEMKLTNPGRAALEAYLARVEQSLSGRVDVDATDVVAGIREHVETELLATAVERPTVEDVADILERLGPAEALAHSQILDSGGASDVSRTAAFAILLVTVVGLVLLLLPGPLFPLGWACLIAGLVSARLALPREGGHDMPARFLTAFWQAGVLTGFLAVLLAPAVLAWAWAQTGGPLVGVLAGHAGVVGRARPTGYWAGMVAVAAGATGVWWLVTGWLLQRHDSRLRRGLGAGSRMLPRRSGRNLLVAGTALLVTGIVTWLL